MKDRLLARLRSKKGFTLIELLVVIAIIAILVVIVVVAIDPVERLRDAEDREASSNVRSTGTLIGTCITSVLAASGTMPGDCDSIGDLATYGNVPTAVAIANNGDNICASQTGRTGTVWSYQSDTGQVTSAVAIVCLP